MGVFLNREIPLLLHWLRCVDAPSSFGRFSRGRTRQLESVPSPRGGGPPHNGVSNSPRRSSLTTALAWCDCVLGQRSVSVHRRYYVVIPSGISWVATRGAAAVVPRRRHDAVAPGGLTPLSTAVRRRGVTPPPPRRLHGGATVPLFRGEERRAVDAARKAVTRRLHGGCVPLFGGEERRAVDAARKSRYATVTRRRHGAAVRRRGAPRGRRRA